MASNIHTRLQNEINRVAEVHFYVKHVIEFAFRQAVINPEVRHLVGGYDTELARWRGTFADKFFDMSTMIRLGTAIELCLRTYYMHRKGHSTLIDLQSDRRYRKGIFQRVQNWQQQDGAIVLYRNEIRYDLANNPHLPAIQETMMHRHLYAHNSGLLDDAYIDNIRTMTGKDIRVHPEIAASNYPAEDVYWFEPVKRLNAYIEEARRFFRQFPS
jgi:hypothetical protein